MVKVHVQAAHHPQPPSTQHRRLPRRIEGRFRRIVPHGPAPLHWHHRHLTWSLDGFGSKGRTKSRSQTSGLWTDEDRCSNSGTSSQRREKVRKKKSRRANKYKSREMLWRTKLCKKCTQLRHEAPVEVKMLKAPRVRSICGS